MSEYGCESVRDSPTGGGMTDVWMYGCWSVRGSSSKGETQGTCMSVDVGAFTGPLTAEEEGACVVVEAFASSPAGGGEDACVNVRIGERLRFPHHRGRREDIFVWTWERSRLLPRGVQEDACVRVDLKKRSWPPPRGQTEDTCVDVEALIAPAQGRESRTDVCVWIWKRSQRPSGRREGTHVGV